MDIDMKKIALCRQKILLIILLNFSDWLCTVTLLRHDGFFEANPLMVNLLDKPFLCFAVKCILPFILMSYIFYALPVSSNGIVKAVNIIMIVLGVIYLLINILHIFNFVILFNMQ
ncbi:MAG: DUF5658 family protein [Ruminococcus sp.]